MSTPADGFKILKHANTFAGIIELCSLQSWLPSGSAAPELQHFQPAFLSRAWLRKGCVWLLFFRLWL